MSLVADIFKVLIISNNGEVIGIDTLEESSINVAGNETDVTGGRGDNILAILNGRRDIEIALNNPEWRMDILAKHLGQEIQVGATEAYAFPKWHEVDESDSITLDETPSLSASIVIVDKDEKPIESSTYTVSSNKVTFDSGVSVGEHVKVVTYKYQTSAETETLDIDNTKFPENVKVVLETLEIDNNEKPISKLQFEYPEVKPSTDFSFNTSSAKQQSNQESKLRVLKPKFSETIGTFKRIPISA
ncbi:hypothetical protein V1503_18860 [Bacillus sp. SCS-151]|uniref:hypothetical protein n=1 Tax=Nanhaiella sioensis TaxID=3115293 RepID=UPI0039797D94